MVSSAHPLASKAGSDILKAGGNAMDAAVATSLVLGVVSPVYSGIGGGGFLLYYDSSRGTTTALDYREVAPLKARSDMFRLRKDGEVENDENRMGVLSIAVPSMLSGQAHALKKYGTMEIAKVAKPAIQLGRKGFGLAPSLRKILLENRDSGADKVKGSRLLHSVFYRAGKKRPTLKKKIVMRQLAGTLELLSEEENYSGSIGDSIVDFVGENGGLLTKDDFRRYEVKERSPVEGTYHGDKIVSMPPPSSGGITLIETLNILEPLELGRLYKTRRVQALHAIIEALNLSFADRNEYIGDPDFVSVPKEKLVSKEYATDRRELFSFAKSMTEVIPSRSSIHEGGSTTHFCVVDSHGNVVVATETIECYFGSGLAVPTTGVILNDEMHDFDPKPGRINSVEPRKRPLSSMAPTIVFREGEPILALGSAGGPRIITATLQAMLNYLEFGMSLANSVTAPRLHSQKPSTVFAEGGLLSPSEAKSLSSLGHKLEPKPKLDLFFGGVQAVSVDKAGVSGMADPRRDGFAVGPK